MVAATIHLRLQVVADLVDELNLQERLAANKVPYDTFLAELLFAVKDIVDGLLGYLPRHPLLGVFSYQIAVFACQLAVFRDDERDVLRHSVLPAGIMFFDIYHHNVSYERP